MNRSMRRIAGVGGVVVAAGAVVVTALVRLMLHDHAQWLERSYRNRWAFRDVPTRRGSICDREGRVLVEDRPRFSLELDYDTFRRHNPIGAALAGAKLLWPDAFDHAHLQGAEAAALRLFELPAQALHADATSRTTARDLRFYVASIAAALSTKPRSECGRALLAAAAERSGRAVVDVLGLSRSDLRLRLRERIGRLGALAATLRAAGAVADLGAELEQAWRRHAAPEHPALPTRTLARALPFDVAAELACERELWLGFRLQPAVSRAATAAATALPSLASLIGVTTAAGGDEDDAGRVDTLARDLAAQAQLIEALPEDVDLPDDALDRLTDRATSFLRYRVMLGGRFGRSGVEAAMEEQLAGQPGLRFVERDVRAREQLLYHNLDVNPGHDARITVDAELQEILERTLEADARGLDTAMAVIDVCSGDVLALGGRPLTLIGRDGSEVARAVSPAVSWRNAGYIGSLAKPFVLLEQLAAAREGRLPQDLPPLLPCHRRYKKIPGTSRWLECDGEHGAGGTDPVAAIAESCNVYFFQAAEQLQLEGLRRAYARAGWAEDAAFDSVQGNVPGAPGFARPRLDPRGHAVQHVGIGYGVKANALSVARAYAGLATGSLPSLGLLVDRGRGPPVGLDVPPSDLALVRDGLRRCVTSGTAASIEGLAELGVHGKTGTAEVNDADENNAWFAGFVLAPSGRATIAFCAVAYTVDDHGKESARMVAHFLRGVGEVATLRRRWLEGVEER